MMTCSLVNTLMEENLKLDIYLDQVPIENKSYQRLVGRLMYFAHTCLDLAYSLNVVSQFMHSSSE